MALKDILVYIDNDPGVDARLDVAIALAEQHGAHLTGLYVNRGIMLPTVVDAPISPELMTLLESQAAERMNDAEQVFAKATAKSDALTEWRVADGNPAEQLELQGRYVDLIVLSQKQKDILNSEYGGLPDAAVMGSGRPVLIVPYVGAQPTLGRRALVAWNASRECVRAVNDALPILRRDGLC